jgi:hypothetical protein
MDRDKKIERIIRGWKARQEWQGMYFGPDQDTLRQMAMIAATEVEGPEEWDVGETIPDTQMAVYDSRKVKWERGHHEESDVEVWAAMLRVPELQGYVGTVYERPIEQATRSRTNRTHAPERKTQPTHVEEECPKCGDTGPHKLADVVLLCCACDHIWVRHGEQCRIEHPTYGFVCDRVRGHYLSNGPEGKRTWHYDSSVGHSFDNEWRSTADERPAPVRRKTQEWCPKCSDNGPHTVDEFTHEAVCAACENVWVETPARCDAYHPEYGFSCCRVKGHRVHTDQQETWHYDPVGHWFNGVGTSTADKRPTEEPPAPDQKATAAYLTVLGDAAAVLDAAHTTLNRVGQAYRQKRGFNAALCHTAESNATLCDQASTTINSLIKAEERKA